MQLQSDNLDSNFGSEVGLAAIRHSVGWQTNKHGEAGAGCDGGGAGSCNPDGPTVPTQLQAGAVNHAAYLEMVGRRSRIRKSGCRACSGYFRRCANDS